MYGAFLERLENGEMIFAIISIPKKNAWFMNFLSIPLFFSLIL